MFLRNWLKNWWPVPESLFGYFAAFGIHFNTNKIAIKFLGYNCGCSASHMWLSYCFCIWKSFQYIQTISSGKALVCSPFVPTDFHWNKSWWFRELKNLVSGWLSRHERPFQAAPFLAKRNTRAGISLFLRNSRATYPFGIIKWRIARFGSTVVKITLTRLFACV